MKKNSCVKIRFVNKSWMYCTTWVVMPLTFWSTLYSVTDHEKVKKHIPDQSIKKIKTKKIKPEFMHV